MAAGAIPGPIALSTNGGSTWNLSSAPNGNWISIDMDVTGTRIVGVQYLGGMYLSTDGGASWSPVSVGSLGTSSYEYESVTISTTGTRLATAVMNGPIQVSSNGGTTWTAATLVGGAALTDEFRAIDSSGDGSLVVAGTQNGHLYVSNDGGATFAPRAVTVGGVAATDGWYRIKVSDDGNTIVLAGNYVYTSGSSGIYVSRDRGLTWTRSYGDSKPYTSISASANGDVISVTYSNDGSGQTGGVLLSSNGGVSFAPYAAPAGETNWRAMAISGTADRGVLAAGTFPSTTGRVYVSGKLVP
jgi:photosystem II stability/assembly factor-like uncharacterized protein